MTDKDLNLSGLCSDDRKHCILRPQRKDGGRMEGQTERKFLPHSSVLYRLSISSLERHSIHVELN